MAAAALTEARRRLAQGRPKTGLAGPFDLPDPHAEQVRFLSSPAKRKVIRAGRRGGKTVGAGIMAVEAMRLGRRVLYGAPTTEQIAAFWKVVTRAVTADVDAGRVYKNESLHVLEIPGTEARIRAKTAWNADTLRGDYADLLILDEWQLQDETAWTEVGAPMLLDNDGDAVFIYTPPSLHSRSASKARDPLHAAKMFKRAAADITGRWAGFHFTSRSNPHISQQAIADLTYDMTALAIRQEIEAEDIDEAPGALWQRAIIEAGRVTRHPDLHSCVVGVDPSATTGGDEAGIIVAGAASCSCRGAPEAHAFIVADASLQGSPAAWARAAVTAYHVHRAGDLVAEMNNGGEMVAITIGTVEGAPPVELVHASRGKATRAEPVAALYEQGRVHHVGTFPQLEDELCQWQPGDASPNRLDALVWAVTHLAIWQATGDTLIVPGPDPLAELERRY